MSSLKVYYYYYYYVFALVMSYLKQEQGLPLPLMCDAFVCVHIIDAVEIPAAFNHY